MRSDPARPEASDRLQAVRQRLHTGDADGLVHGVVGGRLRGALHLWAAQGYGGGRGMSRQVKPGYARALDIRRGRVDLSHGGGGRAMMQLIRELFARHLGNAYLEQGNDGTVLP